MTTTASHRPLAPDWLPRQLRRRIDRQLRKLIERHVCSLCGNAFPHNTHMFDGLDARGNIALAGECCSDQVVDVFIMGLSSRAGL